jgi:hypothetical protein
MQIISIPRCSRRRLVCRSGRHHYIASSHNESCRMAHSGQCLPIPTETAYGRWVGIGLGLMSPVGTESRAVATPRTLTRINNTGHPNYPDRPWDGQNSCCVRAAARYNVLLSVAWQERAKRGQQEHIWLDSVIGGFPGYLVLGIVHLFTPIYCASNAMNCGYCSTEQADRFVC